MSDTDILQKSALEQGRMIRARAITSEDLTDLYLRRIAAMDCEINAFVQVFADSALRAARRADRTRARSPFHGVPLAIKDLNAVRGTFLRFGSRAFERLLSPFDDMVVALLRRAGFVFLGKTATSEFGAMPVTEPDIHPPTRNPWDRKRSAGGSSGGAAAALALDLIPIAQGSDAGGSIRIPASFCGVVGVKPSRGVVINPFGMDEADIIWTCGPLARSVEDAAALLEVMAGGVPGAQRFLPTTRGLTRRLRVHHASDVHVVATSEDVRAVVEHVAALLSELGHQVERGPMMPGLSVDEFLPIWQFSTAQVPVPDWSVTQPITRWLAEAGKKLDRRSVAAKIASLGERVQLAFGEADVWLTPTVAVGPPPIGWLRDVPPEEAFHRAAQLAAFTAPFNVSGQPALSLPAGADRWGNPIGIQLAGRPGQDRMILDLARDLEARLAWRGLRHLSAEPSAIATLASGPPI